MATHGPRVVLVTWPGTVQALSCPANPERPRGGLLIPTRQRARSRRLALAARTWRPLISWRIGMRKVKGRGKEIPGPSAERLNAELTYTPYLDNDVKVPTQHHKQRYELTTLIPIAHTEPPPPGLNLTNLNQRLLRLIQARPGNRQPQPRDASTPARPSADPPTSLA